jgi:endonuclease/exonuclease/phosphatase family metal-dependent hydrolase
MKKMSFMLGKSSAATSLAFSVALLLVGCAVADDSLTRPTFRVMTYNIHHGEGIDAKLDLERIAAVIKEAGADIVALQEVDKGVERSGRRDMPAELAALTGFTCIFSNNYHYQGGEYGNAVLTRFPVLAATNHHFRMLRALEPRGLLQVTLAVHGRQLALLNTHLDAGREDHERWSSVGEIESILKAYAGQPLLFGGDFNATPDSRVIQKLSTWLTDPWPLVAAGPGHTIPVKQPSKRIDYIWMAKDSPLIPVKAWVPHSIASDHLPVVMEFQWR